MRILVNAIPLINVHTGIGRYLRCLYSELERLYGGAQLEIGYFDGLRVLPAMPEGPRDLARWTKMVDFFWKLPTCCSLPVRLALHYRRERLFYAAARDYDLYHEPAFFPFSVPKTVKTVFTVHDLSLIRYPDFHPRERVLYFNLFFSRRCKRVKHFLAVSDFTKNEMIDCLALDPEKIMVTPLSCDREIFYPPPAAGVRAVKAKFNLPERYFLFVGSGDPRKNMETIPAALAEAGLDIPLVVAGWAGWSGGQALAQRVIPLGYVSDQDLAKIYGGAQAFILPSLYEGFGLPLLEAMACGCPVVASRKASLPEVMGDAGLYIDNPGDSRELAGALVAVAGNDMLRTRLSEQGLKQAAKFSWTATARATYKVFQKALDS